MKQYKERINHTPPSETRVEQGACSHRFHASTEELAALVSIPDRIQDNIRTAKP